VRACGKQFVRARDLRIHIRTVHEKRRGHECETCGKQFGHVENLRSHVFHVHKNPPPHEVRSRGADSELNMPFTAADAQNAEKISRNMPRKDEHPALLSSEPTAPKIYGAHESSRQKRSSKRRYQAGSMIGSTWVLLDHAVLTSHLR